MSHAVSRLRAERLEMSSKPFTARGSRAPRCEGCRVIPEYCLCALRPKVPTNAGMFLLMHDVEALKPTNTGWLIADLVTDTFAYRWFRTSVEPEIPALLNDPQWQPYLVFPGEFVAPERVVTEVQVEEGKRPLFILLDATWTEARKMFRKSPYLDKFPVLSLQPEQLSRYRLRRSKRDDHLCTSEVAALCLELAGEPRAASALDAYLDVFTAHYLGAKFQRPVDPEDEVHQRMAEFL
ncbi:tRNA-uridine aminocarboxypropyltransferase [Pseudomonas turukhanskensis]|uniref:tRNA-uridine aminocarboxypropyltransferase n=1 Tax=Pseudomonas turukhanskensis TaxID=1806536 RepID=A0A9W6K1W7_9PSED|nr:tRNA-uridine aminocarboxypropyltransferase [Pseudomonas turukhanskensis]GLK87976.1 DTW domain-containing protein [Pseudomonas turukhanskensis]